MNNIWTDRNWAPMLLKEIEQPFNSKDYIFELKFDGIRAIVFVSPKEFQIKSRNGKVLTDLFPELQEIQKLVHTNTIYDGEIIVMGTNGPSFSELQKRLHTKDPEKIKQLSTIYPVSFMAFDILYEKKDLTKIELMKRKKYLEKYPDTNYFIKTKGIEQNGKKFFQKIKELNLEGMVAKKKNGLYYLGERTNEFIKIKNIQEDEFYIGGYEEKKNKILSVAIGKLIDNQLHFVGKVKVSTKNQLYRQIIDRKISKNPFCDFDETINYVNPTLTCHVSYLEKTKNNHLRHPVLKER